MSDHGSFLTSRLPRTHMIRPASSGSTRTSSHQCKERVRESEEQIKPSSNKVSGPQNDLKQTSAVPVLPVLPWAFYWLSGVAAQSLQKHVLDSSSWFSRSDTAFPLLSCHPSPCRKRGVLTRESLLTAMQVCAQMFRW